jgi:hypothetical protein
MKSSQQLRDRLLQRLITIVDTDEELSPAMVSACVNFLKQFPPPEELDELPAAKQLSNTLQKYANVMPFGGSAN